MCSRSQPGVEGQFKGPSGAFVTYCNISCFFFCFFVVFFGIHVNVDVAKSLPKCHTNMILASYNLDNNGTLALISPITFLPVFIMPRHKKWRGIMLYHPNF